MDHQLIQEIYSARVRTERFEELLASWAEKIVGTSSLDRPEIVSHIRQAVSLFDELDGETRAFDESSDSAGLSGPYPIMMCDQRGSIHQANVPARTRYGVEQVDELPFDSEALVALREAIARIASRPAAAAVELVTAANLQAATCRPVRAALGARGERQGRSRPARQQRALLA